MRKYLYALIVLTQLDGSQVWIESTSIQAIRPSHEQGQCQTGGGSAIRLTSIGLCVKETPSEVRQKIKDAE